MLGQRRRRWTNIDPALGLCPVFAGKLYHYIGWMPSQSWWDGSYKALLWTKTAFLADMIRWPNVGLLLGQRRRRWASSKPTLGQRVLSVGLCLSIPTSTQWQRTIQMVPAALLKVSAIDFGVTVYWKALLLSTGDFVKNAISLYYYVFDIFVTFIN